MKSLKILVFSLPAYGHLNPMLSVMKELVHQGHTVVTHNIDTFKKQIEETGTIFISTSTYVTEQDLDFPQNELLLAHHLLDITKKITPIFLDIVKQEHYDLIIYDCFAMWGKIVAQKYTIPAVSFVPSFVLRRDVIRSYKRLIIQQQIKMFSHPWKVFSFIRKYQKLRDYYQMKNQDLSKFTTNDEDLNIVFTSRELQPNAHLINSTYKFVGPSLTARKEDKEIIHLLSPDKKIIYISMGTVYNNLQEFYAFCIDALKDTEYQVIMSVGSKIDISAFGKIPNNFVIRNSIPQLEVLKRASLFISHAGMNSINESLYYGVPLLLNPQIFEQRINAQRIQDLKAGIILQPKTLTKHSLLQQIEELLQSKTYSENAKKLQETLVHAGGYKKAVEEILVYAESFAHESK